MVQTATIHLALALSKSMQIYAWIIRSSFSLRNNPKVMMRKNQYDWQKTEIRRHLEQRELVSAIYRHFQKCEMNEENELAINARRGFCFKDFQKTFQKSWNIKRKRHKYSITLIGESGIDTGGVLENFIQVL